MSTLMHGQPAIDRTGLSPNDLAVIAYTTGTTDTPKPFA